MCINSLVCCHLAFPSLQNKERDEEKDKNKQKGKRFYRKFISHTLALPFSYLISFQSFPLHQLSCPFNRQADDDDDGGIKRIRIILYTQFMDGDAFCRDEKNKLLNSHIQYT